MRRILLFLVLASSFAGLPGCGTKGPLYLPESAPEQLSGSDTHDTR